MQRHLLVRKAAVFAAIAGLACSAAQAASLTHDYELNNSYADSLGGPSLANAGGSLTATGYNFAPNQGLSLSNGISPGNYSIELNFAFSDVNSWRKIVDFKNLSSDDGLYNLSTSLNFFPVAGGPSGQIPANTPTDVILTRDGASNTVVGYVNGVQQITFADTSQRGVFSSPGNIAQFFQDDFATGQREASGGTVDFIRIFDGALTSSEAASLFQNGPSTAVPEPSQFASLAVFTLGLAGLTLRGRKRRSDAA